VSGPAVDVTQAHEHARTQQAALEQEVTRPLIDVWRAIEADLSRLQGRWPTLSPAGRVQALTTIARAAASRMRSVEARTRHVLPGVVADAYGASAIAAAGQAGGRYTSARADLALITSLTGDLLADLQQAIGFVETTARAMVTDLTSLAERQSRPVELETALRERGVTAVVYRDGSRHGLDDYARMAVRTKLAQAWQLGALRLLKGADVGWVEVVDGVGCGWSSHLDPQKANGRVIPVDEALSVPTAHPNCVRTVVPRLDVGSDAQAAAADPSVPASPGSGEVESPSVRTAGGLLDIRSPQLLSVAAARHATLLARAGQPAATRTGLTPMRTRITGPGSRPAGSG
jgi:predicted RNA-binding Zn ribbon-like protein